MVLGASVADGAGEKLWLDSAIDEAINQREGRLGLLLGLLILLRRRGLFDEVQQAAVTGSRDNVGPYANVIFNSIPTVKTDILI